ncbi:uncharacterized protein LOC135468600 [Liolophura sinensis]|uniref:uncharacterized protein LOC135468600 n=1 Tax=Liolophura sinensis TaxID=3198878 RepID=UPI00315845F3
MGCGGSTERKNKEDAHLTAGVLPRQKISIRVGADVKIHDKASNKIIFVFGGPGSKKGRFIENLVNMFEVELISAEEIIVKTLSKKLPEGEYLDKTFAVQEMVKEKPVLLSLNWVFREINKILDSNQNKVYLIDIMPNLKFLLRNENYLKDLAYDMATFEERYPVSFALNLSMPPDKVVKKKPKSPAKQSGNQKGPPSKAKSDEADSSRTQRRAVMYDTCTKPFLEYFQNSERLVNVDMSSGLMELIWDTVADFFGNMAFSHVRVINSVILFSFDEQEYNRVDLERYGMRSIGLQSCVDDPQAPVEKLLKSLCTIINTSEKNTCAFSVDLTGTAITKDSADKFEKRAVVFIDVEKCTLDKYIKYQNKGVPCTDEFKGVLSGDNVVCLFPMDTSTELCRRIALCLAECRAH